ncbi:MAG: hypothetical protein K2G26_06180, partial [Clostridia bacterium]|nr:hypothetical protein [Clostridia bacterium]
MRPALHLNLTAADAASITKLDSPQGTTTETDYNGDPQSLKTIANKPAWYKQALYTNPALMNVVPDTVTDAGDTTVTVSLLSNKYEWNDSATNASQDRTFTFKVNKKPLSINWTTDSDGNKVAQFADVNEIYSRDSGTKYPQLVTKYYEDGDNPNNLKNLPTGLGTWHAVALLDNASTCNYKVDATESFTVNKKQVAYPVLSTSGSLPYNGASQEFTFTGFDSDLMNYTVPNGADSFDGTALKATNADDYTPVYTLKNTSLYEWSGTAPAAVTITPKAIAVAFAGEKKTEWEKGDTVSFTISAAALPGESVQLAATYQKANGTPFNLTVTDNGDGTHTVTIPATLGRGNYTLTVKVADSCKNYAAVREATHNFEITAQGLALDESDLVWLIDGRSYTTADLKDGFIEIEYTGAPVIPTVDDSTFVDFSIDNYGGDSSAVTVGSYERTVHIVANSAEYAFDQTFTLKFKIVPKVLDFSGAVWEYSADGVNWTEMTASNKPSYTGD